MVYLIGTVIFMVQAQGRINDMEKKQAAAQAELVKKMTESNAQMKAQLNVLADRAGMNHKELSRKATELQAKEHETETRLKADEETTKQQIGAVTSDVNGVKGEVVKVSADVTDTKNDLAVTKGKLDHAIGDLNKHSELIATSHDELEMLKHRGDRDYFEFTLQKDKIPTHLSIVSLQLRRPIPRRASSRCMCWRKTRRLRRKTGPSTSRCSFIPAAIARCLKWW